MEKKVYDKMVDCLKKSGMPTTEIAYLIRDIPRDVSDVGRTDADIRCYEDGVVW